MPEQCFRAQQTGSITWITPKCGSYPGEEVTTKLSENYVEGYVFPYGKPGQVTCAGVLWLDPAGQEQFNAILEIKFKISVRNVWSHFHIKSGQLSISNMITFKLSSANTFKRGIPEKMKEPPCGRCRACTNASQARPSHITRR